METNYHFGQIVWIEAREDVRGSEIAGERPWIIVSNDHLNAGGVCVCVPLSCSNHKVLPTHARIQSFAKPSVALCEQLHTFSAERFLENRRTGNITRVEAERVKRALSNVFGF